MERAHGYSDAHNLRHHDVDVYPHSDDHTFLHRSAHSKPHIETAHTPAHGDVRRVRLALSNRPGVANTHAHESATHTHAHPGATDQYPAATATPAATFPHKHSTTHKNALAAHRYTSTIAHAYAPTHASAARCYYGDSVTGL